MDKEFNQVKHFYAKCNHPLDMSEMAREVFDYADYTLCPQDYHALYITIDKDDNPVIYICSNIIKLEKAQLWDFLYIATNIFKGLATPTLKLQQLRRTFRTKDSQRKASAIYKNISDINKVIKKQTKKDIKIIKKRNSGYCINIDPQKPYSLFVHEDILNQK